MPKLPNVLMRIVSDYVPNIVQMLLEDAASDNDIAMAIDHISWCDPRHVSVENVWRAVRAVEGAWAKWIDVLRDLPDRLGDWQIKYLGAPVLLHAWHRTNWLRLEHISNAFRREVADQNLEILVQLADILVVHRDIDDIELNVFQGNPSKTILEWWIAYSRRSAETIINHTPSWAGCVASRGVLVNSDLLSREAKQAMQSYEQARMRKQRRHSKKCSCKKCVT